MPTDLALLQRRAITAWRVLARTAYPQMWQGFITDWQSEADENAAWMMYSANYLLRTAGLRWAVDPFSLSERLPGLHRPNFERDLAPCQVIVLTHAHADHLDLTLLHALRRLPMQWVIPQHTLAKVLEHIDLPPSRIVIPQNSVPMRFGALTLTAFDGLHLHGTHGVPATGYLAEFGTQRWLFPGDTRVYDASLLPSFGSLTGCFAHLWLGRACAALPDPPMLDPFCAFFRALNPRRLVVTHLREVGRDENDYWDDWHFQMVKKALAEDFPGGSLQRALMGERVALGE
jgi:hypothetical protein